MLRLGLAPTTTRTPSIPLATILSRAILTATLAAFGCGSDAPPAEFPDGTSSSEGTDPTNVSVSTSTPSDSSGDPITTTTTTSTDDSSDSGGRETTDTGSESESSGGVCDRGEVGCRCDGTVCNGDAVCVQGGCEAPQTCGVDGYEPNDTEATAVDLGELADGDDPGSIAGELDHADDVDWFTYAGIDELGPGVAPTRDIDTDGELRLCKFLECPDGILETEVTCPEGSALAQSPGGRPGCCGDASIAMPDFNCTGTTDDSAQVYIRIDNAVPQCVQYTISYEF